MISFQQPERSPKAGPSPFTGPSLGMRLRVPLLLVALLLVLAARAQLAEPRIHRAISKVLGEPAAIASDLTQPPALNTDQLATIRDNTPFSAREQGAWFTLLGKLQGNDQRDQLPSLGTVGYATLVAVPNTYRAKLVTVQGTVRRVEEVPPAENMLGLAQLYRVTIQPEGGEVWPITVYTIDKPNIPEGNPTTVVGYFFKNLSYRWAKGVGTTPVIVARRLGTYKRATPTATSHPKEKTPDWKALAEVVPVAGKPLGRSFLAQLGVDLSTYDAVKDQRPLTAADSDPFYATLLAVRQTPATQLVRLAVAGLTDYTQRHGETTGTTRREQQVGAAVRRQAADGLYAAAPLFLDGVGQRGELLVFDTMVRRVVQIEAQPVGHYYELEAFAEDSQNLPLVFCMAELPDGFPTGESVRQPARLAGFFFKQWLYRSRHRSGTGDDAARFAPLLIGRAPIAIAMPRSPSRPGWEVGLVGVGLLASAAGLIVWFHHSDHKHRQKLGTDPPAPSHDFSQLP